MLICHLDLYNMTPRTAVYIMQEFLGKIPVQYTPVHLIEILHVYTPIFPLYMGCLITVEEEINSTRWGLLFNFLCGIGITRSNSEVVQFCILHAYCICLLPSTDN